jgi:hypothetical protein
MKKVLLLWLTLIALAPLSRADEGMWLPMFIDRLNYEDMKEHGLQLTAEEIYSINNSSLKDAIVMMGGGFCTAEIISSKGLILTNHHCGYDAIQEYSTPEDNILDNGFWAKTHADEIPIEGLYVSILDRMEDVSARVLNGITDQTTPGDRDKIVAANLSEVKNGFELASNQRVSVKSFFYGSEYYAFVYTDYHDVRLVGAPPQDIGKFGGDTDNWMWPRHTGDFSMFRIYANKENEGAKFSEENQPFVPAHHLPISMEGTPEGSYAMVFGFPGSTDRYMTSYKIQNQLDVYQPAIVKIRSVKLDKLRNDMEADDKVRLQYASKYASTSNYWKYFIGQQEQLKNNKVKEQKERIEQAFSNWVNEDPTRIAKYGNALSDVQKSQEILREFIIPRTYFFEAIYGADANKMCYKVAGLQQMLEKKENEAKLMNEEQIGQLKEGIAQQAAGLSAGLDAHFKDINYATSVKVYGALLELYSKDVPAKFQGETLSKITKKYKGDFNKFAEEAFARSVLTDKTRMMEYLKDPQAKILEKDPIYQIFMETYLTYSSASNPEADEMFENGMRLFVEGLREMNPDKSYYPDANSTLRLTYGNVLPYEPKDAMYYRHFTTSNGILEKEDPNHSDFEVPEKLINMIKAEDFGPYLDADGTMHICFLSNNDITGGNSGSPVVNGKGHIIGLAFDGNWEAMSGDIFFEKNIQRTISVDIRYVLYVIDKFAGASHLIDEMTLVHPEKTSSSAHEDEFMLDNSTKTSGS